MTANNMLEQYEASSTQTNIKIGLNCHQVKDVFCCETRGSSKVQSTRMNLSTHVDLEDSMIALGETYLSVILKGVQFKSMY